MLRKQFVNFAIIGLMGFFVDTGFLYFLVYIIDIDLYFGRVLSYLFAVTFTWLLNRWHTFGCSNEKTTREILLTQWFKFASCNVVGAIINYSIYAFLISYYGFFYSNPVFAVAVGTIFSVNINFILSKNYVFRSR